MKKLIFLLILMTAHNAISQDILRLILANKAANRNVDIIIPPTTGVKSIPRPDCYNTSITWSVADEYTPTSAAQMSLSANQNKVALISNSFSLANATIASGQTIVPRGGAISGTGINLNGATIAENGQRAFTTAARFSGLYNNGCLSPEAFGATSTDNGANDSNAVEAMINNSQKGWGYPTSVYNVNSTKTYNRGGVFRWSGNDCKMTSTYSGPNNNDYLFVWDDTRHEFMDMEIDGLSNGLTGLTRLRRFAYVIEGTGFSLDNVFLHSLMTSTRVNGDRAIGYRFDMNGDDVIDVKIYNTKIWDIVAWGDGSPAGDNTDGISKGMWFNYRTNIKTSSTGLIDMDNIDVKRMLGDDAEFAFFAAGWQNLGNTGRYSHSIQVRIANSVFERSARRCIKGMEPNIGIDNCTIIIMPIEEVVTGIGGNPYIVTGAFSFGLTDNPQAHEWNRNSWVRNCTFTQLGSEGVGQFIGMANTRNMEVTGNTFTFPTPSNEQAITIGGSGTGPRYDGVNIHNNVFTNSGIGFSAIGTFSSPQHPKSILIANNTFDYDVAVSSRMGVMSSGRTTAHFRNIYFENNTIDLNYLNSYGSFGGLIGSRWSTVQFSNVRITGNTLNLTGNRTNQKFIDVLGSFGSSNRIQNNTANGMTANNAIKIDATQDFLNSNNVNGSGQTLGIQ